MLSEIHQAPEEVRRVALLSGKLYYELVKEREARKLSNVVALIRIEELCPFPFQELHKTLEAYKHVRDVFWVQEEPRNQGAFTHVQGRIQEVLHRLGKGPLLYKGRAEDAVPAPGVGKVYGAQQKAVTDSVFDGL